MKPVIFFGLRHIWGDGNCSATDYCDDTPPQNGPTYGCPPAGSLNGCLSPVAKMFEDYMDYADDGCSNTFTNDQKTRMQTVMQFSPRRVELATAGTCSPPPGNSIRFSVGSKTISEAGTVLTCPRYRDFILNVNVFTTSTGNATISFNKSGSATDNVDYQIFPSAVTYTNGDNSQKNITVRILDDGFAEPDETIIISYTISGVGVIPADANQICTFIIKDDDAPLIINNAGTANILSENFESSSGLPFGWHFANFVGSSGVNVWTISSNGGAGITGNAAHVTNDVATKPLHYSITDPSEALIYTPTINTTGYRNPKLSFKYKCGGDWDNNGGIYDFGSLVYAFTGTNFNLMRDDSGNAYFFYGNDVVLSLDNYPLPSILNNASFRIGFRWKNDDVYGVDPPFLVDDIILSGETRKIESQAGLSGNENIFSNQDVYMLGSADGQVIMRIRNNSADIGCLTATVSQAGNGQIPVTTTSGSYMRTQKVFQVTPSSPNNTVTYEGTFYFSDAELATWSPSEKLNLKILQVQDGVNLSGVLTAANSKIITPISVIQNIPGGFISYTGNFTGFSQFMLVSPNFALPVNLLSFDVKAKGKNIQLNWSTAQEINNKGFAIERSLDGTNFNKIGWVAGQGTTTLKSNYIYSDNFVQPNTNYYYRLRQTDVDGKEMLSIIRTARIDKSGLELVVTPNPAKDKISIFISGAGQTSDIQLMNGLGQIIHKWKKIDAFSATHTLEVSHLARGIYILSVGLGNERIIKKIVLQ